MKELTRKNSKIDKDYLHSFIDKLKIDNKIKKELKQISPYNYTGI
jgi:adenylosuccinate lyase